MPVTLQLPAQLDEANAVEFAARLFEHADAKQLVLDFTPLQFVRPLGTLLLASELRRFFSTLSRSFTGKGIDIIGCPAHSYLAHIGFFKGIGLPFGKQPGQAAGSATYMPIRVLTRAELENNSRYHDPRFVDLSERAKLGNAIQSEAMRLAALVTGDPRPHINTQIAYCLREVIRNVFEHGQIDQCIVYAQRISGYIEAAIVDRGCGIYASLGEKHGLPSEISALEAAVQPGVSGANLDDTGDEWSNSGFGLYVLSEVGKRLGSFLLCSGASMLRAEDRGASTASLPHKLAGTAIGLRFRQLKGSTFDAYVRDIVGAGEAMATQSGRNVKASKSTQSSSMS
jgi:anti-sigma regulatory factor (Ser/Thr protein kinase)